MDVVVVLVVVFIVVAAAAAYIVFSVRTARAAREAQRVLPVSRAPGLKVSPLAEPLPVLRSTQRMPSGPAAQPVASPSPQKPVPPASGAPPLFDLDLEPEAVAPPVEIVWWKQFDGRSVSLDDMARLRLIGDLGVVAKEWCVPLLAHAYQEERKPGHRQAALTALAACRSRAAIGTFRLALASEDAAERAIASDGLADLEPQPQPKIRRTVERY
jgi:hypothetical protein